MGCCGRYHCNCGSVSTERKAPSWQELDPNVPDVAHLSLTVARVYQGIQDLLSASDLVVEANIVKVFPSSETNPETHSLATDALVNITRVLKGPNMSQVLIFQNGGASGLHQRIPDQYHLVSERDQNILFLTKEPPQFFLSTVRSAVPNNWGVVRTV